MNRTLLRVTALIALATAAACGGSGGGDGGSDGGTAGTATTAARSDHAHAVQAHRISIQPAAMTSTPAGVRVGSAADVVAAPIAEHPAAVVIPAIPAAGGPSFRFRPYYAGASAPTLSVFANYTAIGVGGTVPTCKSGQTVREQNHPGGPGTRARARIRP